MGPSKSKRKVAWCPPPLGVLKFTMDGAAHSKLGLVGIDGVLRNHKGEVQNMFSKHIGIKDSNEVEVLAIWKLFVSTVRHIGIALWCRVTHSIPYLG